jgi:hypothetical protein
MDEVSAKCWTFGEWLEEQRQLQVEGAAYGKTEGDPEKVCKDPEAMARHYQWNYAAISQELSELMDEVGWKPWATSRHMNRQQVMAEAVDALHFLANMLLGVGATGEELTAIYEAKIQKNLLRWRSDYTGVDEKCPGCGRDMQELPFGHVMLPVEDHKHCNYEHDQGYM